MRSKDPARTTLQKTFEHNRVTPDGIVQPPGALQ